MAGGGAGGTGVMSGGKGACGGLPGGARLDPVEGHNPRSGSAPRAGIIDIAVAIPWRRLSAAAIAAAWGGRGGRGRRAVASYDEDSITLAVAAALECLDERAAEELGALYFASVSAPYIEKSCATIVASALDLGGMLRTADFGGSLRAGSSALAAALDAVDAGGVETALVAAADCRIAPPGSSLEAVLGDGGAAVLVGREEPIAIPLASAYIPHNIMDLWRTEQRSLRSGDTRFGRVEAYAKYAVAASKEAMKRAGTGPREISRAVLPSPDGRGHGAVARELGLRPESVVDPGAEELGVLGTAHPFLMLESALQASERGERILFTACGDGCDAIIFEATASVEAFRKRRRKAAPAVEIGYVKYLAFKKLLAEGPEEGRPFSSPIQMSREEGLSLRLRAKKCKACATINTLNLRVCPHCGRRDDFDEVKLTRRGVLHTYTQEHYYPTPEPPVTMAVVDLEGGGRYLAQMTDVEPSEVRIGMEVELTFRKLHEGGGYHNYCWKCRPVRRTGRGGAGAERAAASDTNQITSKGAGGGGGEVGAGGKISGGGSRWA
ncbi:MAG: OB-fold domain-containing protein [Thermoplasmata archaeon]